MDTECSENPKIRRTRSTPAALEIREIIILATSPRMSETIASRRCIIISNTSVMTIGVRTQGVG